MSDFDDYCADLIEQSKRFLEKSRESQSGNQDAYRAYINSSLLLSMSALEAYINGISSEIMLMGNLDTLDKSILSEQQYHFDKGKFKIRPKALKIYRTVERIEFIYTKFKGKSIDGSKELWWNDLNTSIKLRNDIVHPKEKVTLEISHIEKAILSVINCVDSLCKAVYDKPFPKTNIGLQSKYTF